MDRRLFAIFGMVSACTAVLTGGAGAQDTPTAVGSEDPAPAAAPSAPSAPSAHQFTFPGISGGALALSDYAGQPVLLVNTASRCGFTKQYDGLQQVWSDYRDQGLVVLGAPSNSFRQELADNAAVKEFCDIRFDLDFPMTGIIDVKGEDSHPFYTWARQVSGDEGFPSWNFNKALIGKDGSLIATFASRTAPTSDTLRTAIAAALAESHAAEDDAADGDGA